MKPYEQNKLIQIALYILNKTNGIDYYHLFKIMYFAEMKHLTKWGSKIIADDFYAIKYGPVPTQLYDTVKDNRNAEPGLVFLFKESIKKGDKDASNVLWAKKEADLNYISKSEIQDLDESIEENAHLLFNDLMNKSHDEAWNEAYNHEHGNAIITSESIAKVMNADPNTIQYIKDQKEIDTALA